MFSPYPPELAKAYCLELAKKISIEKCLDFEDLNGSPVPQKNRNPQFKTDFDNPNTRGQMFAVLICTDTTGKEVVLKAFSGQYNSQWLIPGWVPPLLDVEAFNKEVLRADGEIKQLTAEITLLKSAESEQCSKNEKDILKLQEQRRKLSNISLANIYAMYRFPCVDGSVKRFAEIMGTLPPTGTGECCAPKLLGYAFEHNLQPISMAEFFYGNSNPSNTRHHLEFYPPCDEKCALVLPTMLGLEILYKDEDIVVINKPSGLLSIPGRSEENKDCVTSRLRTLFPDCIEQPSVHRLDMDTSGLMVLALTKEAHRNLSIQFMEGRVSKQYEAILRGKLPTSNVKGKIELPFRLDVENRPHQIYDALQGKMGTTLWEKLEEWRCHKDISADTHLTRVRFIPLTGRTHQLRLHSMHDLGLSTPIVGDNLYGIQLKGERLLLHACKLSFTHPHTTQQMNFESIVPF